MKAGFFITANSNVAHPLRRCVVAVNSSLGVPPRKASGSRFPLYSSLVPRCGVPLQSLTRSVVTSVAIGFVMLVSAQTVVTEAVPLHLLPKVAFRPLILDSTQLFLSPDVVWRCSYMDGSTGFDWFDSDFAKVKRCDCAEETYRLLPYGRFIGRYQYKLVASSPRGSLVRTSDTTFLYTEYEFNDSTSIHRELPMVFDTSKVVRCDTAYTESLHDGTRLRMEVSKFVELKAQ